MHAIHTWRALRHPLKSPRATPTSVDSALESALRPSFSQTSLKRLTICISAGRENLIWRACGRSLDNEWAFWSLQIQMIGRRRGRWSFWSRFWPGRPIFQGSTTTAVVTESKSHFFSLAYRMSVEEVDVRIHLTTMYFNKKLWDHGRRNIHCRHHLWLHRFRLWWLRQVSNCRRLSLTPKQAVFGRLQFAQNGHRYCIE